VLSLHGAWTQCVGERLGENLSIIPESAIKAGMSGSPIVSSDGRAIGLISKGMKNLILKEALPLRVFRPPGLAIPGLAVTRAAQT
jgi:hypothetical protein